MRPLTVSVKSLLICTALTALSGSTAGQGTTAERLSRLEARVDSLYLLVQGKSTAVSDSITPFRDNLHLVWGIVSPEGQILNKVFFIINYNRQWKIPIWVAYHLSSSDLLGDEDRTGDFRPDPELSVELRSELADYKRSGFDRGHNAPAADFSRSHEAMSTTFLLSNMSPQTAALNQRIWANLESKVRDLVRQDGEAWIVTGNICMKSDSTLTEPTSFVGTGHVAVPTHCFKAVLSQTSSGDFHLSAFLMPNQRDRIPGTIADYLIRVDRLEQICGYDFYPGLPDSLETRLEQQITDNWIH